MTNVNQVNIEGTNYAVLNGQTNVGDFFASNITNISKGQTNINNEGTNYNIVDFPKRLCDLNIGDIVYIDLEADYDCVLETNNHIPEFSLYSNLPNSYYKINEYADNKEAQLVEVKNTGSPQQQTCFGPVKEGKIPTPFIVVNIGKPEEKFQKEFKDEYDNVDGVWLLAYDIYKLSTMSYNSQYSTSKIYHFLNTQYLKRMDEKVSNSILEAGIWTYKNTGNSLTLSPLELQYSKVFLLSTLEYGYTPSEYDFVNNNYNSNTLKTTTRHSGQPLRYFYEESNDRLKTQFYGKDKNYFTRTIDSQSTTWICDHEVGNYHSYFRTESSSSYEGIRPAFILPNDFLVKSKNTSQNSNEYIIVGSLKQIEDNKNVTVEFKPHPNSPNACNNSLTVYFLKESEENGELARYGSIAVGFWQERNSTNLSLKKGDNIQLYYNENDTTIIGYKINGEMQSGNQFNYQVNYNTIIELEQDPNTTYKYWVHIKEEKGET